MNVPSYLQPHMAAIRASAAIGNPLAEQLGKLLELNPSPQELSSIERSVQVTFDAWMRGEMEKQK